MAHFLLMGTPLDCYLPHDGNPRKGMSNADSVADLLKSADTSYQIASEEDKQTCREKACNYYRQASLKYPNDPYIMGKLVEFELLTNSGLDVATEMNATIQTAMDQCRSQIEARQNLPWACFELGKLFLFLGNPLQALICYAAGIADIDPAPDEVTGLIGNALRTFHNLESVSDRIDGFNWVLGFLKLTLTLRSGKRFHEQLGCIDGVISSLRLQINPVIILTGALVRLSDSRRKLMIEAFKGYRGNIINHISHIGAGITGALYDTYGEAITTYMTLYYDPCHREYDERFEDKLTKIHTAESSPLGALSYWRALSPNRKDFSDIRLLAIGGTEAAAVECAIALALGVKVGVLTEGGGAPARLLLDSIWASCKRRGLLHALPDQPDALAAFVMGVCREPCR